MKMLPHEGRILLMLAILALMEGQRLAASETLRPAPHDVLETILLRDLRDGSLDEHDLLAAALIAGGVHSRDELARYRKKFDELSGRGESLDAQVPSPRILFEILHERLLTGRYDLEYTELTRTLDEGHFNCVSAAILYCCLCERWNWKARAVASPEHVYVRLQDSQGCDVETTHADGFDCGSALLHGFSETQVREISMVQLLAKTYYNRAVAKLDHRQFPEAVALLRISLELDANDPSARANLLAAINNWSLHECNKRHFVRAAELLVEGRSIDPEYIPFRVNDLHVYQKWVLELCQQARYGECIRLLEAGYARRPDADLFARGRYTVYRLWVEALSQQGRWGTAWDVLCQARARYGSQPDWRPTEATVIHDMADCLVRRGRKGEAREILDRGLLLQPACPLLLEKYSSLTGGDS